MANDVEILDPMLIRMARSIAASQGSTDWRSFVPMATASLQALREPSSEMLEAAMPGMPDWGELPEDWRKMIDHVLGESSEFNDNERALRQKKAI